jgi:hypothetical protein
MCVQNFNDSRGLAIRITYRISLRSSSLWEPRHPLLKVVTHSVMNMTKNRRSNLAKAGRAVRSPFLHVSSSSSRYVVKGKGSAFLDADPPLSSLGLVFKSVDRPGRCGTWYRISMPRTMSLCAHISANPAKATFAVGEILDRCGNDPSAGSPTETLLRLHLPLNDKV